jgi:hypothetical protein
MFRGFWKKKDKSRRRGQTDDSVRTNKNNKEEDERGGGREELVTTHAANASTTTRNEASEHQISSPSSSSSCDNNNNERPSRSVNDFQSKEELRQALLSNKKGSFHTPDCFLLNHDFLQDLETAIDDPANDVMKDLDHKLDWVLENYDRKTTEQQSLDHELRRLLVLKSYLVLDSELRLSFERVTGLASKQFKCPIALISLVDLGRQWFVSNRGLGNVRETPRKLAFCAHAIMGKKDDCLIVPDATKDSRFKDNPLVTGPPDVRFYAGAPLISPEGYKLGTLCVIDNKARPEGLSLEEKETLKDLSSMAVETLVDHRRMKSVWFNNLVKTHFPELEVPNEDSDDEYTLARCEDENCPEEDPDVAVFLELTKRMSLANLIFLLQTQAREQNLSLDYLEQCAALVADTKEAPAKPAKPKHVRFAEVNQEVCAEVHNVESWKHIKELWWSPEEMQEIRMEAAKTAKFYRMHRPRYTQSVHIVASNVEPPTVVEDHMRQLTEKWSYARGLESHIVRLLRGNRKSTVKAVLQEQFECRCSDDNVEMTCQCLREESLSRSQLSTQFAQNMALCDQIDSLKASVSRWHASLPVLTY